MIISPPFLLPRNANETDEAWINRCMMGGEPGDGAFPLSHALQWHGGMHLTEPAANAPVRAIADGKWFTSAGLPHSRQGRWIRSTHKRT